MNKTLSFLKLAVLLALSLFADRSLAQEPAEAPESDTPNVVESGEANRNQFAQEISLAMKAGDFRLAKTYFTRLMQDQELSQPQKLQWMVVLAQTGEKEKAQKILDELAPDDGVGFAPAHRVKALQLAFARKDKSAPLPLKLLERHLIRSRDQSPQVQQAWALYHRANDDPDKAIEALRIGARADPTFYIAIAKYQGELNRPEDQLLTLRKAELASSRMLDQQPTDSKTRWLLANSMTQQGRIDDAQKILVEGMAVNPDAAMRQANAEFFTMRHDREQAGQNRVGKRIAYLFLALGTQPQYLPIYERLIKISAEKDSGDENFVRVRDELNRLVAGDDPNPMAHFALSNILWQYKEFEESKRHLELACKVEPRLTIALNNLAWILAHQDSPELDRALELAKQAVKQAPKDGRYHDTLGTIYLKQKKYKDAAAEFELALADVKDPIAVRKKLIDVYTKLNKQDQVQLHKDKLESSQ